jgi:hypothetical protein
MTRIKHSGPPITHYGPKMLSSYRPRTGINQVHTLKGLFQTGDLDPKMGNEAILNESWNIDLHDGFTTNMLTFITSLKRGASFFWHVCTPAMARHSLWLDLATSSNRFRIAVFKVNSKHPHVTYWAEGLISGMLSSDIGLSYTNKSS